MGRDEGNRKGREGSWNRAADLLRPALIILIMYDVLLYFDAQRHAATVGL